jgi:hypothetical protein
MAKSRRPKISLDELVTMLLLVSTLNPDSYKDSADGAKVKAAIYKAKSMVKIENDGVHTSVSIDRFEIVS